VGLESRQHLTVHNPKERGLLQDDKATTKNIARSGYLHAPSCYGYENHDITRRSNPAYTIGKKSQESERRSPDPCYIRSGETGFGKLNVPVPNRKEKRVERVFVPTPGPATYYV
jgi:hypothetical protein